MTDPSRAAGERDTQTVTKDGTSVLSTIHDVRMRSTPNHVDHRGSVFEIWEGDDSFWEKPVVYAYQFSVRPGIMKGWGIHEFKDDRYTIISGEVLLVLYDARPDSPTHGVVQKAVLSDRGVRQVVIPAGVWHLSATMTNEEARLLNCPTEVYHHEAPDRVTLPWDSREIPVSMVDLLPRY